MTSPHETDPGLREIALPCVLRKDYEPRLPEKTFLITVDKNGTAGGQVEQAAAFANMSRKNPNATWEDQSTVVFRLDRDLPARIFLASLWRRVMTRNGTARFELEGGLYYSLPVQFADTRRKSSAERAHFKIDIAPSGEFYAVRFKAFGGMLPPDAQAGSWVSCDERDAVNSAGHWMTKQAPNSSYEIAVLARLNVTISETLGMINAFAAKMRRIESVFFSEQKTPVHSFVIGVHGNA